MTHDSHVREATPQIVDMTARLCVNCRHYRRVDEPRKNMSVHQCAHPALVDPVTGDYVNCEDARAPHTRCGVAGALFTSSSDAPQGV